MDLTKLSNEDFNILFENRNKENYVEMFEEFNRRYSIAAKDKLKKKFEDLLNSIPDEKISFLGVENKNNPKSYFNFRVLKKGEEHFTISETWYENGILNRSVLKSTNNTSDFICEDVDGLKIQLLMYLEALLKNVIK